MWFKGLLAKYSRVARYVCGGGIAAGFFFAVYIFLTAHLHFWYLAASIVAYLATLLANFFLQKVWVFEDSSATSVHRQAGLFFATAVLNLVLNVLAMYLLVDVLRFQKIFAQLIVIILLAIMNYVVYRMVIFSRYAQ